MSRPILLVLAAVALAPTLQAQSNPAYPDSGRRVRVTLAGASAVIGVVTDISDSGLTLRAEDGIVMVPRASITRLDLSQGMRRNTARGIQRGSLIGAAAGAVVGALAWADEKPNGWFNLGAAWVPLSAGLLALPGAVVGAVIGGSSTSEHWTRVQLENGWPPVEPLLIQHDGRVVAGIRVGF
jgi:hypothetical protein